jgi:hypothetical protein
MAHNLQALEKKLNQIFVKQAPALPPGSKKALVQYLPWINLVLGLWSLYTLYLVWHWAHYTNSLINYANSLGAIYGGPTTLNRLDFGIWLGLLVLAVEALLYLCAFPGTRDRKKSGWNLLFYALLVNATYGVVILFTSYGGFGSLFASVISSAIGLYLLFQIRSSYTTPSAAKATKTAKKAS